MKQDWSSKAALYEALALAFLFTKEELAEALVSGEYAEALVEIAVANGFDPSLASTTGTTLIEYQGRETDEVLHELRREYTRLFVGAPEPAVSPFAGVWYAEELGVEPLLFVNKESMAVERFMRSCGVGQPEGTNEPLDHIATELEFLQYLCLLHSGAVQPLKSIELPENAYEDFYHKHFIDFSHKVAAATIERSRVPFFVAVAKVLAALPEETGMTASL
jgi:TorA maturation chaperone TorD